MQHPIPFLFAHERLALGEALRRDECRELKRAATDPAWADWHMQNARFSRRLLGMVESAGEPE